MLTSESGPMSKIPNYPFKPVCLANKETTVSPTLDPKLNIVGWTKLHCTVDMNT